MKLDDIAIVTVSAVAPAAALSGNAAVLLREIADRVRRLIDSGESAAIDLLAMPLSAADLDWLRERLGAGEIRIALDADGESTLNETNCPGVWWVEHHNPAGGVMSAFIEVTHVPKLVKAHVDDIRSGLERLELLVANMS
ncbi:MAG: hydrogenase expression/formation C-terminal domain-containing protein [Rhodoferax sp.]|uniref:hydrogenase expression/formation C-terminal domain-containing protein n=1 Tax=Rhodoferax sp. TaxID=50421 RepID=UPI00260A58F3|nr:hydrogenase expression/formation C-terminal domain-containing protein [Rhodoferax sp.]MDD2880117.1 hydrogenase expression/formation C-terminal domain-containing protein [Rhodoferax sp.]